MRRLILSLTILLLGWGLATAQEKLAPPSGGTAEAESGEAAETEAGEPTETAAIEPAMELPERKPPKPPEPKSKKLPGARELFASVPGPAKLAARAIGFYSKGCLSGGIALPLNGPDWQVMRVSRNRYWGSPQLVDYMERLASDARALDGWPGLLVGDMSQPRGGPMLTGHTSHQVGLDADPDHPRRLSMGKRSQPAHRNLERRRAQGDGRNLAVDVVDALRGNFAEEFGRDNEFITTPCDQSSQDFFCPACRVNIGTIEEIDPGFPAAVEHGRRSGFIGIPTK